MGREGTLGHFEELVLLAVHLGKGEAFSVSIRRDISGRTGNDVAMGAIHSALDRLERKGLVGPGAGPTDGAPRTRGRPRRYYDILPAGISALQEARRVRDAMWAGVSLRPGSP